MLFEVLGLWGKVDRDWNQKRTMKVTVVRSDTARGFFIYYYFYFVLFIYIPAIVLPFLAPPPTVLHPIPPSHCLQEYVSLPTLPSLPYPPPRPSHSLGTQVSEGLGVASLTQVRPGSPLLWMCWGLASASV